MSDPTHVDQSRPDGLTFQWAHKERRGLWLFASAVLALGGLVFTALVVRVARVEPRSVELATHEVLMLEPSSPLAQPIIARAADVSFLLLGKRVRDDGEPTLTDASPVLVPSFKGYELKLKDLPETQVSSPIPRWLKPDEAPLPSRSELARIEQRQFAQAVPEYRLGVSLGGQLSERELSRRVRVAGPIPDDALHVTFQAAVDAAGRVVFALPMQDDATVLKETENLRLAIGRLRFVPRPAAALAWGTIKFEWEAQKER